MKIAYISYEYPPHTARGGIATYVYNAAYLMKSRGHQVEVFSGADQSKSEMINGIFVHLIRGGDLEFSKNVMPIFQERHDTIGFDMVEVPEFQSNGIAIQKKFSQLPLIVKLHTPSFLINRLNTSNFNYVNKIRFLFSGFIRGNFSRPFWNYDRKSDQEYHSAKLASAIHTPSISLGDIVSKEWDIKREEIRQVPYPFVLNEELTKIEGLPNHFTVLFVGRLEFRKGIQAFAKIISLVLKQNKNIKFLFVGRDGTYPLKKYTFKEFIISKNRKYEASLEFNNGVKPYEMANIYRSASVCVFPSLWENFPNVCLEAMSASKAIIGSNKGGMVDMLTDPECGILKDPYDFKGIAEEILNLAKNPNRCLAMGIKARQTVLKKYNAEIIGVCMENAYTHAMLCDPKSDPN